MHDVAESHLGVFTRPGESSRTMSEYEDDQRKRRMWVTLGLVVLVMIIIVVILALTVFKAREPRMQINSIDLETFSAGADSLNMSLLLDLTIHNPNRASFKYSEGHTRLVYYGDPVGQAVIPAGEIPSRGEAYLSVLLFLQAARVLANHNLPGNIISGRLPVATTTTLAGTVIALGTVTLFKHHAVVTSDCDITVYVANATLESFYETLMHFFNTGSLQVRLVGLEESLHKGIVDMPMTAQAILKSFPTRM